MKVWKRWGTASDLAAVGAFLAVDLALFGNCIMPTQDATPVSRRWRFGG